MRFTFYLVIAAVLFSACEKLPHPGQTPFNINIYNLKGIKINEVNAGLQIRIEDEKFRDINKQIDLRQEGAIAFDKIEVPIIEAKDNYIITAVPIMNYPEVRSITLAIRVRNQFIVMCQVCIWYRPTVRGT